MSMTSNSWEILESRVAKLEEQNRRLKAGCVLTGLAVVCILSLGAVVATRFLRIPAWKRRLAGL
jgi:hypothetical protein